LVDVFHSAEQKITKEQIREYVRTHFKKQHVSLFGVKKYFGGGRTQGFCLIYDNEDSLRKFEPPSRIRRVFFIFINLN
jgi:small subunit ribosomal protein S24e